jgi:NAD(P)-dependent dehydrogenase (short-subunit alcohol dehydrogenase family)
MTSIENRIAVVTGGASGIGRGIAEELLARGAQVVIADISAPAAEATAAELGCEAAWVDVADPDSVQALADGVLRLHGRVDIVVNNAGVGPKGDISGMTTSDWRWLIDVNLFGVINGVTVFLPLLERNTDGGHVVNTSSMSAFSPMAGLGGYAVTKAGVSVLTEVLAAELHASGSRVRATELVPGPVATNIRDSQRSRPRAVASGLSVFDQTAPPELVRDPRWVGRLVVDAIQNDEPYAITHPELWVRVAERTQRIGRAFAADHRHDVSAGGGE